MANIVIIDDEAEICEVLQTMLEQQEHRVRTTTHPQNLAQILTPKPDVVLLDVLLPDINGLECMPQIKSLAPEAKIVIITGLNDYHLADAFYEAGACGFLNKPLRRDQILTTLQRVLASSPDSQLGAPPLPCT